MQEIVFSVLNRMKEYYKAIRFVTLMLMSCLLAVLAGLWIDEQIHTTPLFLFILLTYAIGGNLYRLLKGSSEDG